MDKPCPLVFGCPRGVCGLLLSGGFSSSHLVLIIIMRRLPEDRWIMSPQGDSQWQKMVRYLEVQWWPHKELCVTAWTDNIRHYGKSTTSIVEGSHANLKHWLQPSRNDLLRFVEKLQGFYDHHVSRYQNSLARAQSQGVAPFIQSTFYSMTVWVINTRGLRLVEQQRRLIIQDATERWMHPERQVNHPPCSHRWRSTMGLPCKHELATFVEDESHVVQRSLFDPHWVIPGGHHAPDRPRLLDPRIRKQRRLKRVDNHRRNEGINGTAREPTRAERLDPNHPSTPPPTGANAGGPIHPLQERREAEPGRAVLPANRPQHVAGNCMCRSVCVTSLCSCKTQRIMCTNNCHRGIRCSNKEQYGPLDFDYRRIYFPKEQTKGLQITFREWNTPEVREFQNGILGGCRTLCNLWTWANTRRFLGLGDTLEVDWDGDHKSLANVPLVVPPGRGFFNPEEVIAALEKNGDRGFAWSVGLTTKHQDTIKFLGTVPKRIFLCALSRPVTKIGILQAVFPQFDHLAEGYGVFGKIAEQSKQETFRIGWFRAMTTGAPERTGTLRRVARDILGIEENSELSTLVNQMTNMTNAPPERYARPAIDIWGQIMTAKAGMNDERASGLLNDKADPTWFSGKKKKSKEIDFRNARSQLRRYSAHCD